MTEHGMLFVGNFLSGNRAHRHYCEDLSERLEASGWRVTRTSTHTGRVRRLFDMVTTAWAKRGAYRIAHVDLFAGPAFVWAEAVCFELRRLGKPFVVTLHGGKLPEHARQWPRRTRRLLASANAVTSPSRYLRDEMRAYAPDVVVIPNGLEIARHAPRARTAAAPRLVWVRTFHAVYNPTLAVAALGRLGSDATLTMIGADGGDGSVAATEQRARELGVSNRVRIIRGVPHREVAGYLAEADVFLNTSNVDNTPLSVLEAMASQLCVVSTNVGGVPYLLDDGHDALLVPPRDAAAMAAAVQRVTSDPALATRLAAAARRKAESYDWSAVIAKWNELLGSITGA